jgi:hypothetical protein
MIEPSLGALDEYRYRMKIVFISPSKIKAELNMYPYGWTPRSLSALTFQVNHGESLIVKKIKTIVIIGPNRPVKTTFDGRIKEGSAAYT